jgi:hypothetical protein
MAPSSRSLKNTKAIIPLPADSTTRRQWSRQTITHADKNTKRSSTDVMCHRERKSRENVEWLPYRKPELVSLPGVVR